MTLIGLIGMMKMKNKTILKNYNLNDWSDFIIRRCVLNNQDATYKEISELLGISKRHLERHLIRLKLTTNKSYKLK